ncbi:DUF2512 family protein [Sporosarcina sp. Te-1]|uniref:DUF2512 family protein n=1 Tax=Sporosarcina sp. Te-1 TaxID=2818390 RepID=UPI001AA0072A|nr:DUF2512 family protein [Sporosarcina sp. Te-1]QTD41789.1 DUF2512 family protein [Sporosarcina sp. Te-1]
MYNGEGSYVKGFFVKWLMTLAVLWIVLTGIYNVPILSTLLISIVVTGIGYVADIFVMPFLGNLLASAGDFVLNAGIIWVMGFFLFPVTDRLLVISILSSAVLALGELAFHRYMATSVFDQETNTEPWADNHPYFDYDRNLRAEFGEEFDMDEMRDTHEKRENMKKENEKENP